MFYLKIQYINLDLSSKQSLKIVLNACKEVILFCMHLQNEFFVFPCIAEYEERKLRQSGNHSAWGLTKVPWGLA